MSTGLRGVSALDLGPGEYAIEPAEWRRDAKQQLGNLTSGSGEGDEPIWHLYDVERSDGTTVLSVFEDRRSMEGTLRTAGRQFLIRSPDGEPLMAYEPDGYAIGSTSRLEDRTTGDALGSWETSGLLGRVFRGRWELADPDGNRRVKATRNWSLGAITYPDYDLTSAEGTDVGRLVVNRDDLFFRMDVTLERSALPAEVVLAMACGVLWGWSQ